MKKLRRIPFIIFILFIVGCNDFKGEYEGTLWTSTFFREPKPIHILIKRPSRNTAQIELFDPSSQMINSIFLWDLHSTRLKVAIPEYGIHQLKKKGDCYQNKGKLSVTACLGKNNFRVLMKNEVGEDLFDLSGFHFTKSTFPTLEEPRTITLSDALQRAVHDSFDSRLEFQRLIQAKEQMHTVFLQLVPHVTMANILWNTPTTSINSLIYASQNIAPFLLPTKWLSAFKERNLYRAAKAGYQLVRMNVIAATETFAYGYLRDSEVYRTLQSYQQKVYGIMMNVEQLPNSPAKQKLYEDLGMLAKSIELDLLPFDRIVKEGKRNLSLGLGFMNPDAVLDLTLDKEQLPIEEAEEYYSEAAKTSNRVEAFNRSYEREQMFHLRKAGKLNYYKNAFTPFDPGGDSQFAFGLHYFSRMAQAKSVEIDVPTLQFDYIVAKVLNGSDSAYEAYSLAISQYQMLMQCSVVNSIDLQTVEMLPLHKIAEINLEKSNFAGLLRAALENKISIIKTTADFRAARSKIDRTLLRGNYLNLINFPKNNTLD